jgi:threonyl-tRNA synthetase
MAVVGAKEMETDTLSIRTRASGELGSIPITEIIERMKNAITSFDNL